MRSEAMLRELQLQRGRDEAAYSPGGSWLAFTTGSGPDGRPLLNVYGADFDAEPWSKHMVEVQGHGTALLVTFCKALVTDADVTRCSGQVVVKGMSSIPSSGQLRSLGYVGSHMLEYRSAEQLLQVEGTGRGDRRNRGEEGGERGRWGRGKEGQGGS